jgi:outer membrane lipoprotein-sorting protein
MKRIVLALGALALSLPALAQTPAEIFSRFVAATGGAAAYAKVKSQETKGTISIPAQGSSGSFVMRYKAPGKVVMSATMPGIGEMGQGYDGKIGWSRDPFSGTRTLQGAELAQIVNELILSNNPGAYNKVFSKIELLKPGKVGKQPALRVKLTPKVGGPQTLYFDPKTYLMLRRDAEVVTAQGSVPAENYFSDYRVVDGVKMPFKTRTVTGMGEQQMQISQVKNNLSLDDKIFSKPASTPAGKTKM